MKLNTGMNLSVDLSKMEFIYNAATTGPFTEKRRLDDIRTSLSDPNAKGPSIVYAVAADIAREKCMQDLIDRSLLYGAVISERGAIGEEPVRSQRRIHVVSASYNVSTCEVYEVWIEEAYIYVQEYTGNDPGRYFTVHARTRDVVIIPPGWTHCTVSANPSRTMLFSIQRARDYDFDYEQVRAHERAAFFPKVKDGSITFVQST